MLLDLYIVSRMSESEANFILDKAKNIGDAIASARIFNEVQDKTLPLVAIW